MKMSDYQTGCVIGACEKICTQIFSWNYIEFGVPELSFSSEVLEPFIKCVIAGHTVCLIAFAFSTTANSY